MHAALFALLVTGTGKSSFCGPDVYHAPPAQTCRMYRVRAPKALLELAVATNLKDRERGLMDVRALPARRGMIFKFADGDAMRVFWMKNTLIPLEMVFVSSHGVITSVAANVPATTHATLDQNIPRRYGPGQFVIELKAGEAARDGIAPGARLLLPDLSAE